MTPSVTVLTVGAFQENCYLLVDPGATTCVVIDPGAEGERIIRAVERSGAVLEAIWLTHAHIDHIGAIAALERRWNVPVYLHPLDDPLYRAADRQAALYGLPWEPPPSPDQALGDGDVLHAGSLRFGVMHAPGHAPGHVVFHGHGVAFVGDCLFAGSIGRTDLPLSNPRDLVASLERIVALPEDTIVYPGHGPVTTIREEVRSNPFLTGAARIAGV
ncbi:MAG TPA: MBL fold metallo-hydrolase [Gemmatimonadaceae bacterium]|nr:MBL fold metallo-hydrolase [Gemmatimonadaceae bacterium]